MPNTVIALKKSSTPSAVPVSLANGELAINFADGKLFYKNTTGSIVTFASGTNSFGSINANGTFVVADSLSDILTLIPGSGIAITADAVNDSITISANTGSFSTRTSNYTAVNGDRLLCDTSAGTFIVTLPATPVNGSTVTIYDKANFTTNPLTVARNGSTIEGIADDFSLDIGQTRNEFVYDGSTWHVYSSIGPRGLPDTTSVASSIAYSVALG